MKFSCTAGQSGAGVVLEVAGDVDLAVHSRFEADLDQAWNGTADLVIDCSGVTFMDSMGLRVLVRTRQRASEGGGGFSLAAPSQPVLRVLDLAGVRSLFPVVPRPATAAP